MSERRWLHVIAAIVAGGAALLLVSSSERAERPRRSAFLAHVDSLQLRAVRAGHGPPNVVLLHGYGESLTSWRSVFERLAEQADVTALDLPGFGLSSKPAQGYTAEAMARAVLGALQALDIDQAVLVGHSLGGAVSAAAALVAPERVRALVLLAPAVVASPLPLEHAARQEVARVRSAIARYEGLRTRFAPPHDPAWLQEAPAALAYLPGQDPAYHRALDAVLREFDFAYLTPERRQRMTLPVLLVWGSHDPLFPTAAGRALVGSLPKAQLVVVPRTWHRPHVERPDTIATVISQYIASLP